MSEDEMAEVGLRVVRWQARRFPHMPPGVDVSDLESVGNEAVAEAVMNYDPEAGASFKTFARRVARNKMVTFLKRARERLKGHTVSAMPEYPVACRRTDDPADIAEAREMVDVNRLAASLPSPGAVAKKVESLRAAMWAALGESDVAAVMGAVVAGAKAGDVRAAKLIIDLVRPRPASTVHQTAVIVNPNDVG